MQKQSINYIQHLSTFFGMIYEDGRLSPAHISLYMALFQFWNINRFQNPISICRGEVMNLSKIGSKATYTRCLKELHEWGFIQYTPSFNPIKGSLVNLYTFGKGSGHGSGKGSGKGSEHGSGKGTVRVVGKVVVPSINSINITNKRNIINYREENEISSSEQKIKKKVSSSIFTAPTVSEAEQFFTEHHATSLEANRFYNHFQSNGWLVGGRTKMKDWKAAARNWMSRSKEFNKPPTNPLSTDTTKNYSEPL